MLFCRCLLVLVTTAVNCYILRRSCLQYANFSYIRENAVLQGSVIRTLMNKSPEECETECIGEYLCKSINLENANQRACELNRYSEADVADGKTLTKKTGWTFKSTDYSDLLVCFWTCFLLISFQGLYFEGLDSLRWRHFVKVKSKTPVNQQLGYRSIVK